jgi:glycosyltransferase involved in cell wall biosynthesis
MIKPKVALIVNDITTESIPIENFSHVPSISFEKILIILNKKTIDAKKEYGKLYPKQSVKIYGCCDSGSVYRLAKFRKILLLNRPNVIHTHHSISAFLAALITKQSYRVAHVITIHNNFRKYKLTHKILFLCCILLADYIVCNSYSTHAALENKIVKYLSKNRKFLVNYNGVDLRSIENQSCI